jgi:hypothetical protein
VKDERHSARQSTLWELELEVAVFRSTRVVVGFAIRFKLLLENLSLTPVEQQYFCCQLVLAAVDFLRE